MGIIRRNTLYICTLVLTFYGLTAYAQTAAIDSGTVYQKIDGFGGENGGPLSWITWNTLTSAQADLLFSPTSGIGISIYRTNNPDGIGSVTWPDLQALQAAVARGAAVELSMSSPPTSMKYSGSWTDGTAGASGSCLPASNYAAYASDIVTKIRELQSNGVPVSYLTVQNEPNSSSITWGACVWDGAAFDTFVKVLGPALSSAGLSPKLILGTAYPYSSNPSYWGPCISDSACAPYISILAGHGYGFPDTPTLYSDSGYNVGNRHFWMEETADQSATFNGSMGPALTLAVNMHNFLVTGQVSSYDYWELAYLNNGGDCQNCQLVDQNFNPTKRYYAFGNFSKFVRPGMVMIGATNNPQSGVYASAFWNQANGAVAIVILNTNGSSISQTVTLSGLSVGSVTPYITDNTNNLASKPSISVSGGSFTATLTPTSVTTFVAAGNASNAPDAPSHLTATVVQ